jgi:hypothetical protein
MATEPAGVRELFSAATTAYRLRSKGAPRRAVCHVRDRGREPPLAVQPPSGVRIPGRGTEGDGDEKAKALTRAELALMLTTLSAEWRLFFEFLTHTGLRISEAIGLTWQHLDFGTRPGARAGAVCEASGRRSNRDTPVETFRHRLGWPSGCGPADATLTAARWRPSLCSSDATMCRCRFDPSLASLVAREGESDRSLYTAFGDEQDLARRTQGESNVDTAERQGPTRVAEERIEGIADLLELVTQGIRVDRWLPISAEGIGGCPCCYSESCHGHLLVGCELRCHEELRRSYGRGKRSVRVRTSQSPVQTFCG